MPKKIDAPITHQRWSTRRRRQTQVYTPPGNHVPQLKRSTYANYSEHVPSREEVFAKPPLTKRLPPDWKPATSSPIFVNPNPKKTVTPPAERKENHDCARFFHGSFGNGYENEIKYATNPFYKYWNRYGRSDLSPCKTFEEDCFICHQPLRPGSVQGEIEFQRGCDNANIAICGMFGCPKTYHRRCVDTYFERGNPDSNEWVCPRHICNTCDEPKLFIGQQCPTCPYSKCWDCLNVALSPRVGAKDNEFMCDTCRITAHNLDAPEMLMNLRTIC